MHNIWNPWYSCAKCNQNCSECRLFYMDKLLDRGEADLYRTMAIFTYPLRKHPNGEYKLKSGEMLRVCISADFFHEKADKWRADAWAVMKRRSDLIFMIPTKRPERIMECLPKDWGDGWENIFLNVVCEDQRRADERISTMLNLPFKHKGVMLTPLIGEVSIDKYLVTGEIQRVVCGGEDFNGGRPCNIDWVKKLHRECVTHNVTFCFNDTGTEFINNGWQYHIVQKEVRSEMASKTGLSFEGKPIEFKLFHQNGKEVTKEERYVPTFLARCQRCGNMPICNGYKDCPLCKDQITSNIVRPLNIADRSRAVGFAY